MGNEIESIKPSLTVILDDGDFIINSAGPIGKVMAQAVLPLLSSAKRVTVISDGEMKVLKRSGPGQANEAAAGAVQSVKPIVTSPASTPKPHVPFTEPLSGDIQDQYVSDLESGMTGEVATGEVPASAQAQPSPAPSPAVPSSPARRIFQDAAAPPAPELAEAEMARLVAEAAQAEQDAARVAEDQRYQRQQAIQSGLDADGESGASETPVQQPRRRRERQLAITGSPCTRCGGTGTAYRIDGDGGAIMDAHGHAMTGTCNVCAGSGQIKKWGGRR